MEGHESWTLALTAASVAEAEGFNETAKAFAEIAAMEMGRNSLFDALARSRELNPHLSCAPSPAVTFASVMVR